MAGNSRQMKEHFTSHYLAEVFRDVFLAERSGVLSLLSSTGPKISFQFDRGMLVDADSPAGATMLAAALRDEGLVGAEVLLEAVPDCATAAELASNLLRRGVAPKSLAVGLKGLIRRAIVDAFAWQAGTYSFEEQRPGHVAFRPDVLFTFESILGGVEVISNFDPLREILLNLPGCLGMSEHQVLPVNRLGLRPHHGFVLSRIDGSMTLSELAKTLPPDSVDEALKFVYGLLVFGIVVIEPRQGEGPFSLREHVTAYHELRGRRRKEERFIQDWVERTAGEASEEILGVAEGTDAEALRRVYEERRALFRREKFLESVRHSHKRELDLIEAKLTQAYFKLELATLEGAQIRAREGVTTVAKDELIKRREFSKTEVQAAQEENIRLAEQYHVKAREYFREGDFHNCIQFCRLAIRFNGAEAPAYHLMADALARNPDRRWQRQAEEAYTRATELEPFNAEHFVTLGLFYKERGLDRRARRMFERALELLPSHAVAAKELKKLRR